MTESESIAVKWLQTTTMRNSAYRYYSPYFSELLDNGFEEHYLLKLPPDTFETYEATKTFMSCTISEFVNAIVKGIKTREKINATTKPQQSLPLRSPNAA
jgi:hypothetical protein